MQDRMINRAKELLQNGTVNRVLGWRVGEFDYDITPDVFTSADDLDKNFVYDTFTGANVSKYLVKETKKEGKVLVFLKPCDSYSLQQLIKEHRVNRDNVYIIGITCDGKSDIEKIKEQGITGISKITENTDDLTVETLYGDSASVSKADAMMERCVSCKNKKIVIFDELLDVENGDVVDDCNRFDMVEKLEAMTPDERFAFWQNELSKCIRCNACRNVCPACTCERCVFDGDTMGAEQKVAYNSFEENMFHIIRAFHVSGRCTDCGECSRVCPQHIPIHLLNRKMIKDMNELYGEYQAGEDMDSRPPLVNFTYDDCEPSIVYDRGGAK